VEWTINFQSRRQASGVDSEVCTTSVPCGLIMTFRLAELNSVVCWSMLSDSERSTSSIVSTVEEFRTNFGKSCRQEEIE
jgi:hypothetical protein